MPGNRARPLKLFPLLAVVAALGVGCSDDPTGPQPGPDPALGRYALQSVDSQPLPTTIFEETVPSEEGDFELRIDIVGGYLDVLADDRYRESLTIRAYIDGHLAPANWFDTGDFARVGETLRFESEHIQNLSFEATHEDGELDVSQDIVGYFHDVGRITHLRFAM